jgi:hypothetical protein
LHAGSTDNQQKAPNQAFCQPAQIPVAEIVKGVADRIRAKFLRRIGLVDLLSPAVLLPDATSLSK